MTQWKSTLSAVSATEVPRVAIIITHPALSAPVRLINDTENLTSQGMEFIACAFECKKPEDAENQPIATQLIVDNIGRELMYWIETSEGGSGSEVTFIQLLRSNPDVWELEISGLIMQKVSCNMKKITATIGRDNAMARPSVLIKYNPETAPGIF